MSRPLISRQPVQNTLTEMARRIEVARVYTRSVALRAMVEPNLIREACFAKNTAVECGEWVANQAVQLHGGMGMSRDTMLTGFYAQARSLRLADGPDEVHKGVIARIELAKRGYGK